MTNKPVFKASSFGYLQFRGEVGVQVAGGISQLQPVYGLICKAIMIMVQLCANPAWHAAVIVSRRPGEQVFHLPFFHQQGKLFGIGCIIHTRRLDALGLGKGMQSFFEADIVPLLNVGKYIPANTTAPGVVIKTLTVRVQR